MNAMNVFFRKYPEPISRRCGCKVGWLSYATQEEAEQAAEVAQAEADRLSFLGFDFGTHVPGEVVKRGAVFEVVIP